MNDVCWKIVRAKTLAALDESQMKFGVLSENWPISSHLEWRNSRGEMECIKQTMETAGSRALFSSESVPVLMMVIHGRAAGGGLRNEKQERNGGRPTLGGVCVRRIPKLKHTKRVYTRGRSRGRKTVLHLVTRTLIWYLCTSWYGEILTRTNSQKNVMRFI